MAKYLHTSQRSVPSCHSLLLVLLLTLLGLLAGCGASTSHPSRPTPVPTKVLKGTITEFPIPTANNSPLRITTGPDGNLWFVEGDQIGRITPSGTITQFPFPASHSDFRGEEYGAGITTGPDGALWFTESGSSKIGRITTSGAITEFPLPASQGASGNRNDPWAITAGPDGHLWFTEGHGNKIGRIT